MRKVALHDERVKVTARFREQGSILKGTKEGECRVFRVELWLDSDEPAGEIADLIRLARRMCFTEDALSRPMELRVSQWLNGEPIEITPGEA